MSRVSMMACVATLGLFVQQSAPASQVGISVQVANPVLQAGKKQTTFLKVGLTGFKMQAAGQRPPVNIVLVLDKSGSMEGQKIVEARKAAIEAVRRLGPNDIVSVVTYDSTVKVLVPATKLTDKQTVCRQISTITAGGQTALFAGVSKGAAEIRKFQDRDRVNRIVLLSDGKANVGPSSAGELGSLGHSLKKEGISVSTMGLGLGYNEDLMAALAGRSGGNHIFIENAGQLARFFEAEFKDVLSVVAQEIAVTIDVENQIRPVRVLGNEAEINGQKVVTQLTQLYSEQEKYVVLEVEIPASPADKPRKLAAVSVSYDNMLTQATDRLAGTASVNFSNDAKRVSASLNPKVWEASVLLIANERNKLATLLCDQGDLEGARRCLQDNAKYLQTNAVRFRSVQLQDYFMLNDKQAVELSRDRLPVLRKQMRREQLKLDVQQRY